jgi:signal peptidase II
VQNILKLSKSQLYVLLGALMVFLLDAVTKITIVQMLEPGESLPIIPGVFHLTRMHNTGAAFSLFYQHPEILTMVAGTFFLILLGYMLTRKSLPMLEAVGFSFILGGALGNLLDRIRLGGVVDFLDFTLINYPVFNLADSFILVGVGLLLWAYVIQHRNKASRI